PVMPMPTDPAKKDQAPMLAPQAFAQAPASGADAGMSFDTDMFGDLGVSGFGLANVLIPGSSSSFGNPPPRVVQVRVPIATHASFKISDVESPRPSDRVYFNYNFYSQIPVGGVNADLHRELIGFEKTFKDGNASFGMRLPFLQT